MERRTYLGSLGTVGITSALPAVSVIYSAVTPTRIRYSSPRKKRPSTVTTRIRRTARSSPRSRSPIRSRRRLSPVTISSANARSSSRIFMDPVRMACVTRSSSTSLGYRKTPSRAATRGRGRLARGDVRPRPRHGPTPCGPTVQSEGSIPPRDTGITSAPRTTRRPRRFSMRRSGSRFGETKSRRITSRRTRPLQGTNRPVPMASSTRSPTRARPDRQRTRNRRASISEGEQAT